MAECDRCGAHITPRFRRVFAGNDGEVHGCPDCMDVQEIINGAPALSSR